MPQRNFQNDLLFNTKYLLEGLKALSSFDEIILHIESPLKPVIIKPNQPVEALLFNNAYDGKKLANKC